MAKTTKKAFAKQWEERLAEMRLEEEKKKKKALEELKKIAVELFARGVISFSCEYNGEGDSGDISYSYYEKDKSFGDKNKKDIDEDTAEKLREIAWLFVPSGFENNDGGFGEIVFDFKNETIHTNHSDRIVEISNTEREYNFDGEKI